MTRPSEVRIIGGQYKRSKLSVASVPGLRPTADRVRETLFNWLGPTLDGWRCLDAFAGSGALGFEAASRGAAQVTLLERHPMLLRNLRLAKERLNASTLCIEASDALIWLARCPPESFELVLIDPPFDSQLFVPATQAAAKAVVPGGFIYLEADTAFQNNHFVDHNLSLYRQGRAGQVHYHLFQKELSPK
jgi:16S rRNA (guanine966-N2)-methyltransferase